MANKIIPPSKNQPNNEPAESPGPTYHPDPQAELEACELRARYWQLMAEAWRLSLALQALEGANT